MEKRGIVTIDGFELGYLIEGEGTPVIVIGSEIYYPRLFSQEIRNQLKLIFIDHRGFVKPPEHVESKAFLLDTIVDDIERIREDSTLINWIKGSN